MGDLPPCPPSRRAPLGEATLRINNKQYETDKLTSPKYPERKMHTPLKYEVQRAEPAVNPRLSAISRDTATDSKRSSQISTVSTNASDGQKRKRTIGPWQLGKTLGSGATARVRLARHVNTGELAAIKIVQKQSAEMSQAGSLAHLHRAESSKPKSDDGTRRMPVGIEREVAIMKLIQHPNVMRLYDIWENRTEIYLVLEYVDGGELFGVITSQGRLSEPEAITYFRQIIAGVGYCHELHICHRDLKPENILLTKDGQIKIADFGMAALHQSPNHKLKTSCGSPHYAAPEVVNGGAYRGDKTDIWSIGVILYATLAGRLPFDTDASGDDLIRHLVPKIKKGVYEMPEDFSPEAADLIYRMLQVNPNNRITIGEIWRHPIVEKYAWLDEHLIPSISPSVKQSGSLVLRRSDISKELLGHLRSLWHRLSEKQIIEALLSQEPNEQKMFYSLLRKYRDAQLENYTPELSFSASDYHLVKEQTLTKTYSTCLFPQPAAKGKGHARQGSRFTVVSNAPETERSYDPYKASQPQHLNSMRPLEHAKITIHRGELSGEETEGSLEDINMVRKTSRKTATPVASGKESGKKPSLAVSRVIASRNSLASSERSKGSGSRVRASVGHKRNVNFNHRRKNSTGSQTKAAAVDTKPSLSRQSNNTEVTDNEGVSLEPVAGGSANYIRSKKNQDTASQSILPASKDGRGSQLWTEDVRQLSSSLAMDCDAAFNRTEIDTKGTDPLHPSKIVRKSSPLISQPPVNAPTSRTPSFDNRPLPPAPPRSESAQKELMEARKQAELRKALEGDEPSGHLDRMVSHIDRLMKTTSPDRRTLSAPAEGKYNTSVWPLPSIHEAGQEDESPRRETDLDKYLKSQLGFKTSRIASAPEPRKPKGYHENRFMRSEAGMQDTIRVVQPSCQSPVKIPAPLTIRKKSSQGSQPVSNAGIFSPETSRSSSRTTSSRKKSSGGDLGRISEDYDADKLYGNGSSTGTVVKKKETWVDRLSKLDAGDYRLQSEPYIHPLIPNPPKKKGFSFSRLFKKKKPDMTIGESGGDDDDMSLPDSTATFQSRSHNRRASNTSNAENRQIEPQQNWLAKLFNVKPAAKIICFSVSARRARQEIVTILKEWRRYGIRDLQVDKRGNRVFGKVAAKNFLDMKEVAFAAEVMKVIEHSRGRSCHLSIARLTQELGAASSFHKVVETLEGVLMCRGMLVADERRKCMMIKTLNSS